MKTITERTKYGSNELITLLALECFFIYCIILSLNSNVQFWFWPLFIFNTFHLLRPKTLSLTIDDKNIIIKKNKGFFKLGVTTDCFEIDKIKIISILGGPNSRHSWHIIKFTDTNNVSSDIVFIDFENRIDAVNSLKSILEKPNVSLRLFTDIYDPQSEYFKTLIMKKYSLIHDKFKININFDKGKYSY